MSITKKLAILCGVGTGLGAALGQKFASTHVVALLARNEASLSTIVEDIRKSGGTAEAFTCDVSDATSVKRAFEGIQKKFGNVADVAVFNANSSFTMGPFLSLSVEALEEGLSLNGTGAFLFSQAVIPMLLENGSGNLFFTGATASIKGSAKFAAFAPPKFALRALSQSLAREFGPQGIHVCHFLIDGIISTERVNRIFGEAADPDTRMDPNAIAQVYFDTSKQSRSAWCAEMDLRPFTEKW